MIPSHYPDIHALSHKHCDSSYKSGSREGRDRGRKLEKTFIPKEKGCFLMACVKEFRIPSSLVGLQQDAEHSSCPSLLASPGLSHPGWQRLPVPRGCRAKALTETPWSLLSTGVPVSHAGFGFDPRNQTLSIKNET